jgi:phosphoribosylformylglycinamidine synthase
MDLKTPGDLIYRLGVPIDAAPVPDLPGHAPAMYRTLHQAMQAGLVRACHDLSEGGLAVAAAEMAIAGRLGMQITSSPDELFAETNGALLVEVQPGDAAAFETHFDRGIVRRIGTVSAAGRFMVAHGGATLVDLPLAALVDSWNRAGSTDAHEA